MLKSTTRSKFARSLLGTAAVASLLTGCAAIDRIKQLGEPVALAPIDNPTAKPGYKPVQMPMHAVAQRFARVLQRSARAHRRRYSDRQGQYQRYGVVPGPNAAEPDYHRRHRDHQFHRRQHDR